MTLNDDGFREIAEDVLSENRRQVKLWGVQNHPSGTGERSDGIKANNAKQWCEAARRKGLLTWKYILYEEVMEAFAEADPAKLREKLIQVAAVATAWVDSIDRAAPAPVHNCAPPKYVPPGTDGRLRYDIYPYGARWTCYICKQLWRVTDRREAPGNVVEMTWTIYRPIVDVALPEGNIT